MKVLVTGARGLLGSELVKLLRIDGIEVVCFDREGFLRASCEDQIHALNGFDYVIHAAANTNVEECEREPDVCYRDNCFLSERLFLSSMKNNAKFVFVSSTGVYGRWKNSPYHEYDKTAPTTVHHESKLITENLVSKSLDSLIIRTGWLFGGERGNNKNFVINRINEISNCPGVISANISQVGSPTYVVDCAQVLIELIKKECTGIFNVVNGGRASRFDYVKEIVRLSGSLAKVLPVEQQYFNRLAKVSENESAFSLRMNFVGCKDLRPWTSALKEYMEDQGLLDCFCC